MLLALYTFGIGIGFDKERLSSIVDQSLPPIAGILLIVAAGGGLKQVLVDSGISKIIASWVEGSTVSPLLLAWFVAVLIRLADRLGDGRHDHHARDPAAGRRDAEQPHLSLLVLAIGAGSLFFSHVNDAGFWLTKQYFGFSISQNIKSWSIMETILSVTGVLMVLALSVVICAHPSDSGHGPAVGCACGFQGRAGGLGKARHGYGESSAAAPCDIVVSHDHSR